MSDLTPITRREQYLAAIAGEGETIPDKPITREEQYLQAILDNGGGGGTTVIGNPSTQATEELEKIKIGSKTYSIPEGGSGTEVVANPEGEATDELNKVQIGEDIYSIPEGSGGDASLESDVVTNTAVGAIPSGTTLARGTSFTDFVKKLTISEVAPTVGFSISKSGNVAKGTSWTETLTLSVTAMGSAKKIKTIAWYEGNTLKQTDTIDSTTTGSWTYTMATATTDNTTFKAVITYTKSDDTDTSTTKTASISFYYNKFRGVVDTLTPSEATVEALTSALATGKGGTYSFTASNQRICYAYPSSLGALTSIKDGNGFSLFDSFTRTTETYTQAGASVSYYLYVLTSPTTVSSYSVTFA